MLKMVIEFTAIWCEPCKYMDPIIEEFAAKYTDVEFIKIDVDELTVSLIFLPFSFLLLNIQNILFSEVLLQIVVSTPTMTTGGPI